MKTGDWLKLLGIAFVAGFVFAILIVAFGGKPKEFTVGPVKVEMPGNTPPTATIPLQQTSETTAQATATTAMQIPAETSTPPTTLPMEVDCSFDFSSLALFVDRTGEGNTVSYNLSDSVFPSGYIVGNGVEAYVNGQSLRRMGDGGVTFIIQIDDRTARGTLTIKDGIFYIVSPEIAERFLQLRVQYLADCYHKNREPVQYPPTPTAALSSSQILCSATIPQSTVNSWRIGETDVPTVQSYIDDFNSNRPGNTGNFDAGDTIPAGVVVATNFDERNANRWKEFPVIALVHSGSWGLFQTTAEYVAPNPGACLSITSK